MSLPELLAAEAQTKISPGQIGTCIKMSDSLLRTNGRRHHLRP